MPLLPFRVRRLLVSARKLVQGKPLAVAPAARPPPSARMRFSALERKHFESMGVRSRAFIRFLWSDHAFHPAWLPLARKLLSAPSNSKRILSVTGKPRVDVDLHAHALAMESIRSLSRRLQAELESTQDDRAKKRIVHKLARLEVEHAKFLLKNRQLLIDHGLKSSSGARGEDKIPHKPVL